jgi:hypothetical protein
MATMMCLFCLTAQAEERTIWECRTTNSGAEPILYLVNGGGRDYVKFSYMRFSALYQADGPQKAWYWHNDGSGYYRYGMILGSDGRAWYHDFSRASGDQPSEPLDYFFCKKGTG